nr:hypothetical protein MACL_00001217 [Theileria orientalis]
MIFRNECPEGWTLSGWDAGVCKAPISYFGPCSSEIISANNRLDKGILEKKCGITWPCLEVCERDLGRCPKNWLSSNNTCTPSSSYKGNCSGPVSLESMEMSQKILWGMKCDIHFTCKDSCQKDYYSKCPKDWKLVGGNCEAPKIYNGPCHSIANLSFFNQKMKNKDKECNESGCTVSPSKAVFTGCVDFEVVTYTIKFNGKDPTSFDIYIYDTESNDSNASYIFVISFDTTSTNPYNCDIDKLRRDRWNWASNITEYTFKDDLVTKLKEQYRKLLRNRTIEFVDGDKETKEVLGYQQDIDEKTNYRIIYTPGADDSILNSTCLFTFNTNYEGKYKDPKIQTGCKKPAEDVTKKQIDSYYLTSVKGHFFDGILVYFAREQEKKDKTPDEHHDKSTPLYLEFIDLRNKDICLQRKDKAGSFWVEEKIEYDNDSKLIEALKKLKDEVNKNEDNTIILDNKKGYNGVTVKPEDGKTAYKKYTYTFEKANKPNLLFDRKPITTDPLKSVDTKAKDVDAYFLKAKDDEDKEPFLIVFNQNGEEQKKENKAYHFGDKYNFENWTQFNSEKPEELDKNIKEKLTKIEDNLNCVHDLRLVRVMAHQILIGKEPKPPEVKKEEKPIRPTVETPESTTEPVNLWLIIGCSIGGFLLIVALAIEPNVPLVISFKCPGNTYNCYFGKLKEAGWDRAYNITRYSFELRTMSRNKKIGFTIGKDNVDIFGIRQEIKDKNFRFIFIPKGEKSLQGNELLFAIDFTKNEPKLSDNSVPAKSKCPGILDHICKHSPNKENCITRSKSLHNQNYNFEVKHKNAIDPYFLNSVKGHFFDGIMVYFVRISDRPPQKPCEEEEDNKCMALLVEFVDSCNSKIQIKRKDKEGYWWSQEKVDYKDDATLLEKLKAIKEQAKDEANTVILDNKDNYLGVTVTPDLSNNFYKKYTHKFDSPKKPNLLFDRKQITFGSTSISDVKAKNVDVYYLKAGGIDDRQPFLIVFDENDQGQNNKKAFHFKYKAKFQEWKKFSEFSKLQSKLDKISKYGMCISNLSLLKWYAYEILTGQDPKPPGKKEEKTPKRPDTFKPPAKDEPLPIPLIAGCSTAGGVFVISSVGGYAIYWYNTTIKLLT